jgi:hypothetical protein
MNALDRIGGSLSQFTCAAPVSFYCDPRLLPVAPLSLLLIAPIRANGVGGSGGVECCTVYYHDEASDVMQCAPTPTLTACCGLLVQHISFDRVVARSALWQV